MYVAVRLAEGGLRGTASAFLKSGRNVIHHEQRLLGDWLPTPTIHKVHPLHQGALREVLLC